MRGEIGVRQQSRTGFTIAPTMQKVTARSIIEVTQKKVQSPINLVPDLKMRS